MGILLWDTIGAKIRIMKADAKIKMSEIDMNTISEKLSETMAKVSEFSNKQRDDNIRNFKEQLKKKPDEVILYNMENAGTEEGRKMCRDEAKRRGIL